MHIKRLIPLVVVLCFGCQQNGTSPTTTPILHSSESIPSAVPLTVVISRSPTPHASEASTASASPTPTAIPTTSGPYEKYTIDALRSRTYGGGSIEVVEKMEETDSFTRYLIRYPSDGLKIYGFANIPKAQGPFPMIVAIHGFVDPINYQTLDYTTPALDKITEAGYIVIHPNLRGYRPSDNGDNLFRVGMTIDVLNLLALIKSKSGPAELFATASPDRIGLWGHSLGGAIALHVLTISPDIKAAVLYASMSGDEIKNARLLSSTSFDPVFQSELATSPIIVKQISPLAYYGNITAPIQLHHGTADQTVPIAWAKETCAALEAAGVLTKCIYYPEEGHTFRSRVAEQFYGAMIHFYQTYLSS